MATHLRNRGTINVDVSILLERLRSAKTGDVIPYSELSELIGADVQRNSRHILASARNRAKSERIYFGAVTRVGLQRLDDSAKVRTGAGLLKRVRRVTRSAAATLASVENFAALSNEDKITHNTTMSVCGVLLQATSEKVKEKISEHVAPIEGGHLAMRKSLEMFA